MFLVNSAWSSQASTSVQQVDGPDVSRGAAGVVRELKEQQLVARGAGGFVGSSGGVRCGSSSSEGGYYSGQDSAGANEFRAFNSSKMREIPMEDLEIAMKVTLIYLYIFLAEQSMREMPS